MKNHDCQKCSLNINSSSFRANLLKQLPLELRQIFACEGFDQPCNKGGKENGTVKICVKDLWVLAFIGRNDRYAVDQAENTLDNLVAGGHSELLCNLFEAASYEIRRRLWLRMTGIHAQRLYLFDALFEKYSLAPVNSGQLPEDLHVYQHQMLFSANSARPLPEGL